MKKESLYRVIIFLAVFTIAGCKSDPTSPPELLINGDAELPRYDSIPAGWQNVQGHWIAAEGDSAKHDCAPAQHGKYLFFAGNDTLGILQQDVDVSKYAKNIDAHKQSFIFAGYVQSLDQGPQSDQAQIIVGSLDNSKKKIDQLYNSDSTRYLNKWELLTDTFVTAPGTRYIRVQLIAIRHVGGDNDGYFDNISLVAQEHSTMKWLLLIIISVVIIIAVVTYLVTKKIKQPKNLFAR